MSESPRLTQSGTPPDLEAASHRHFTPLGKAELARHLTKPHRQSDGSWRSSAGPVSAILQWRLDEIQRTHDEFHAGVGQ